MISEDRMIKSEKIFELSDLRRCYRDGDELVHALAGVDLTISDREFIAVIGSSGSGKSTLMHMLGFMDSPTSGKMLFEGRDVSAIDREERSRLRATSIGFVFQAFNLLPKLTVLDNVILLRHWSVLVWSIVLHIRRVNYLGESVNVWR